MIMRHEYYKLDENKNAIPCSPKEWGDCREKMIANGTKHVASETINDYWISTVWLGLDHRYGDGEPLLFETMIFSGAGKGNEIYCDRYSTWQEAEEGHKKAVEWVKNGCKEQQ